MRRKIREEGAAGVPSQPAPGGAAPFGEAPAHHAGHALTPFGPTADGGPCQCCYCRHMRLVGSVANEGGGAGADGVWGFADGADSAAIKAPAALSVTAANQPGAASFHKRLGAALTAEDCGGGGGPGGSGPASGRSVVSFSAVRPELLAGGGSGSARMGWLGPAATRMNRVSAEPLPPQPQPPGAPEASVIAAAGPADRVPRRHAPSDGV
jgi:hypothetical protein